MNFKTKLLFLLLLLFLFGNSNSTYAQLGPGSIMFTGFNADDPDGFSIVALAPIPSGTIIYFSDNNWTGTAFGTTEGILTWTVTTAIPAGTVVIFNNTFPGPATVTSGTATTTGTFNLAGGGETLYCYLGSPIVPTVFLSAITNNNFVGNSLVGTGLTAGANVTNFSGTPDVMVYNLVAPCTVSIAACAAQIANIGNWITEAGVGNQATNGIAPDFPANVLLAPQVSVLPIELLYFTAQRYTENNVQLNWATASEINNDYFTIDWSSDGVAWHELDRITAVGNSNTLHLYSTNDNRVYLENTYYKLTQTDFDGVSESFKIISLSGAQLLTKEIALFPNPSKGTVNVIGDNVGTETIEIHDGIGRNCSNLAIIKIISENHIQLDFQFSEPAIYLVRIGKHAKMIQIL